MIVIHFFRWVKKRVHFFFNITMQFYGYNDYKSVELFLVIIHLKPNPEIFPKEGQRDLPHN